MSQVSTMSNSPSGHRVGHMPRIHEHSEGARTAQPSRSLAAKQVLDNHSYRSLV